MKRRTRSFTCASAAVACVALAACGSDDEPHGAANGGRSDAAADAPVGGGSGGTGGSAGTGGSGGSGGSMSDGSVPPGDTGPLDYAAETTWLCRPGIARNYCEDDLDATEFLADGTQELVPHVRATNPSFDCFYIYPTVELQGEGNVLDLTDVSYELDPLYSQAARFTRLCTVYAPLYRQVTLPGFGAPNSAELFDFAFADVSDAFQYYLENFNDGRRFVLLGHSQGSMMLTRLLSEQIDNDAALRERMISALLLGTNILVPEGALAGETFQNVPMCTTPGETGCVVSYGSYAAEAPPGDMGSFGIAPAGMTAVCTEPAALAGSNGPYRGSYFPVMLNNPTFAGGATPPAVDTRFVLYRDFFQGECVSAGSHTYLEISLVGAAMDQREPPAYRNMTVESVGFGLHLVDYNIPLDDLLDVVEQQAASAP